MRRKMTSKQRRETQGYKDTMKAFDRQLRIKRGERAEDPEEILENADRFIHRELASEPQVSKEEDMEQRKQLVDDVRNLTDEQFETLPDVMKEKLRNWRKDNPPSKDNKTKVKAFKEWNKLQEEHKLQEEQRAKGERELQEETHRQKKHPILSFPDEMIEDMEPEQEMRIRRMQHELMFPDENKKEDKK